MNNLPEELYAIYLQSPPNLFDAFLVKCQSYYDTPAHTFTEMRNRDNKKIRGDIFEEFCVLYLQHVKKYPAVWLLKDVPDEVIEKLSLGRRDMGIDIIAQTSRETYVSVQCKYKKHTGFRKNVLSWKSLSTFYALCLRTGPWEKYVVMTNCVYTRHQGKKTKQDQSICLKSLQNITGDEWLKMCEKTGNVINTTNKTLSIEEVRQLRLHRFGQESI